MKMKRLNLIPLALTTLMLGACSSEDGLNLGSGSSVAQGEKGYISFSLNLPSVKGSANRVYEEEFANGDNFEYNVKDAVLLLFSGANETNSTFAGAYDLGNISGTTSTDGSNITSTYKIVQEVNNPANTGNIYAMVVVNGKASGVLTEEGTDDAKVWKIKGTQLGNGTTYGTVAGLNLSNDDVTSIANTDAGGCFLMTNAPLYTKAGGVTDPAGGSVQTLTEINPNNIFPTKDEALANPAANVFVERAVAKVTVTGNTTGNNSGSNVASYSINGWTLDITNNSSYLVRNTTNSSGWWGLKADGVNNYRFVSDAAVADGLYRTYWGEDPNYSNTNVSANPSPFTRLVGTTPSSLKGLGANDYCLENTFDLANMKDNQTTRVIVAAALTLNGQSDPIDFYVVDNNKDNVLVKQTDVEKTVKATYLANSDVKAILDQYLEGQLDEDDLTVELDAKKVATGGYVTVTSVTVKDEAASQFKNSTIPDALKSSPDNNAQAKKIIDAVNAAHKIAFYKGGVSYYPVMIKHFGDDLTPWQSNEVYGNNNADFLGRYGVLRNNWYTINVNGIKNIGAPEVPEVYGTPDDPNESWISVSINVLSWAKRSQSVDL